MVHMMVKDSNSFFNRLPTGSQSFPSHMPAPDFIPLEQDNGAFPKAMNVFPNPYSTTYIPIDPYCIPESPYRSAPSSRAQEPSRSKSHSSNSGPNPSTSYDNDKCIEISSDDEESDDDEGKKSSFMRNGRRVFPCSACKKEFKRGVHRRQHYIDVHPELNRFRCSVCDESK